MSQVPIRDGDGLGTALRKARLAEAAHADAVAALRDARSLRLQVLSDETAGFLANGQGMPPLELVVVPGETPRLWIDLVTSVVMEPDPHTYRLVQDRETLFETTDRAAMVETLKRHAAHRIIARERQLSGLSRIPQDLRGYSSAAIIFAWLSGFSLGALALLISVILMGKLAI